MSGKKAIEQLQRINSTRDIISGIHNYCDRWCERCDFTVRCSVFAIGEEEERIRKENNEPEQELVEYVGTMLHDAMDLLSDLAREHGIEFDKTGDEEIDLKKPAKTNYLVQKADEHSKWLFKWFVSNNRKIDEILATLEESSIDDYKLLLDAIEVLKWYIHFIAVKFSRALLSPIDDSPEGRYDNNGSAKIAIIAVTRSIEALAVLLRFIPKQEDVLLVGLVRLERLKKRALKDFPEALSFKRPGFDD